MIDYRLVPVDPTPEMIEAATDAYMPFGDMELALRMAILAAPAVQGEPVAVMYEDGSLLSKADCGDNFEICCKVQTPLYAAPQPAEQKPSLQSPPDDPLGGLEHRADGESNFYTLSRPTGNWVARIQFNGELHAHEQERILNAMLSDRNVRYGDGYHQGYWDARQKSPDVTQLVEALEALLEVRVVEADASYGLACAKAEHALAAHRKGGDAP